MGVFLQVICTFIVSLLTLCVGVGYTWPSSTYKIFESQDTTLNRPMTETELALFGSLSSIGALFSTPILGKCLDLLGRKYCLIISSLINVIAWVIIALSKQVEVVLLGVFITGLQGSMFLVVPVYISEFCQDSIRGSMTSVSFIFYSTGMLISYLLGGCLSYDNMVYVFVSLMAFSTSLLFFLRESPTFLMKKGMEEEAAKAIAFYRNEKVDSKGVLQEIDTIRRALHPDMEDIQNIQMCALTEEEQKLKPIKIEQQEKLSFWQFVKKSRSSRRAFLVTLILATASIFQGLVVVQVYAEPLFLEAVPKLSATMCCILLGIVTIIAGLVSAYLTDVAGRKALMVYASVMAGVCCVLLGTQIQLHWCPHYMTAIFMYFFCAAFTCGAGTVPYVVMAEVFLPEVRSIMSMVIIEWAWLCNFIMLFIFNPLVSIIGLGPVFYIFSSICFCTAIFAIFCLPETKGLPVDAIQLLFTRKSKQYE